MFRCLPLLLSGLVMISAADDARARSSHREAPSITLRTVSEINWGGAVSRGNIRVSGLPRIQAAREAARLKGHSKSAHTAPGERINRPEFGSGSTSPARPTGRRNYNPITVRKRVDSASAFLRMASRTKRPLPVIVMKGRDTSGKSVTIEFRTAMVVSFKGPEIDGEESEPAMEELTISFEGLEFRGYR